VKLTMHVLPVGRSILTRAEAGAPELQPLFRVLPPGTDVRAELVAHTDPHDYRLDLDRILTTPQQRAAVRGGEWHLCAEWQSVAVAGRDRSDDGRAYVLIASDTDDGLRSAAFVAGQYVQDGRFYYIHEPLDATHLRIEPGAAYIIRIPGLDLAARRADDTTWFSLGTVGHAIQQTAGQATAGRWEVLLHLTGGYKAMVPYLLIMAEGINSVFHVDKDVSGGRVPSIRAVSVHEQWPGLGLGDQILLDLPVRWVQDTALDDLRQIKKHVGRNAFLRADEWISWRGQWIEAGGGKLTSAGMIITRVL